MPPSVAEPSTARPHTCHTPAAHGCQFHPLSHARQAFRPPYAAISCWGPGTWSGEGRAARTFGGVVRTAAATSACAPRGRRARPFGRRRAARVQPVPRPSAGFREQIVKSRLAGRIEALACVGRIHHGQNESRERESTGRQPAGPISRRRGLHMCRVSCVYLIRRRRGSAACDEAAVELCRSAAHHLEVQSTRARAPSSKSQAAAPSCPAAGGSERPTRLGEAT